jgi:hypothetical protein
MMKTNAKRKNSAVKKLIPAAGMLALSASMLATSTYAWFTMNKAVTVTGMTLKTKVSSNLLICDTNQEADYVTALSQTRKALLEPVSSATGANGSFYYTLDAKANGDGTANAVYSEYNETTTLDNLTNAGKAKADYNFNLKYGISGTGSTATGDTDEAKWASKIEAANMSDPTAPAYGYVDYVFYLKATSDAANQEIVMTECNLKRNNAAIPDANSAVTEKDNAWRVAVFVNDITAAGGQGTSGALGNSTVGATDPATGTAKAILTRANATTQNKVDATIDKEQALSGTGPAFTDVTYNTWAANNLGKITNAGATAYYKVTVRVWLEGEDVSCKSSTYAALTDSYTLDTKFELLDTGNSSAVAIIGPTATTGA